METNSAASCCTKCPAPGTVTSVQGGDSVKQSDAMWAYFNLGEFMPLPDGLAKPEGFVLTVGTKPVVMRTYLRDAGVRGLCQSYAGIMPRCP